MMANIQKNIIIHIGYHKSASTYFQEEVFPKLPAHYLFFSDINRRCLDIVESPNVDADAIFKWIDSEIAKKEAQYTSETLILSHEELSGHPHGYNTIDPFRTANNLKKLFPDAKILIIIRNQLDYITSLYTFRVASKGYESRSFDEFIQGEGEKGLFEHLEYHRLVEYHQKLFGRHRVLVMPMEMLKSSSEDMLRAILTFMQMPYQNFDSNQAKNVSTKSIFVLSFWRPVNYVFECILNLLVLPFKEKSEAYPLRIFRYSFYGLKRRTSRLLNKSRLAEKKIDITKCSNYLELLERFGKSNAKLEDDIEIGLSKFGYPLMR